MKTSPPKRMPPSKRAAILAATRASQDRAEVAKKLLPPLRPPVTWTNGVRMAADADGKAKYRVGLKGNPLPEIAPLKAPHVPDPLFRDLVARGLSVGQIARELEITVSAVRHRLNVLNLKTDHQKAVEDYKERKADILAAHQMDLLGGITPEKIAVAGVDTLTRSFSSLYDRERVERGLSTEIIDVNQGVARVSQIEELQRRVLLRLGIKKEVGDTTPSTIVGEVSMEESRASA